MLLNTSRTYDLRARTRAGATTSAQSGRAPVESPDVDSPSNEAPPQYEGLAPNAETTSAVRLYSDAVASRPPSPRRERPLSPSIGPIVDHNRARMPVPSNDDSTESLAREVEEEGSGENIETPDQPEYHSGWTRVQRKRARSDGSIPNKRTLTTEQRETVELATKGLTKEQQLKFQKRQSNIRPRRDSSVSSRGEGPSRQKGKAIDPREWGNVNFSSDSLDVDAQAAAFDSLKKRHGSHKNTRRSGAYEKGTETKSSGKEKAQRRKGHHSRGNARPSGRPAESQPVAQIAPKSYLGSALRHVGKSRRSRRWGSPGKETARGMAKVVYRQ